MLEYTKAGDGARLAMLRAARRCQREYAYGPAQGLPDSKVGAFTQALYDEAKKKGWIVISMKDDWKRVFRIRGQGPGVRAAPDRKSGSGERGGQKANILRTQ